MLINTQDLRQHLADPEWVVVDCRFNLAKPDAGYQAYKAAHIPGAHYANLDRDLAAPKYQGSGRHPLPSATALCDTLARWGIERRSTVIAYDDSGGAIAARLWWLLRWVGHERAGLLDGGWPAWSASGFDVSADEPPKRSGRFDGTVGQMPAVSTDEVVSNLKTRDFLLIDARAASRFAGQDETIDPVAGHVPGAMSLPFQGNLTAEGRFQSPRILRERFSAALAGRPVQDVVSMCGSGVTACHNLFALELAGMPGARLYGGSWSEWIASPGRPIATTSD